MSDDIGIKVSQEDYDVLKDTDPYRSALLSTKDAPKEKSSGVSAVDVAHSVSGGIPLVLMFTDNGDGTVSAAAGAVVDDTDALIETKNGVGNEFYRIFYNKI